MIGTLTNIQPEDYLLFIIYGPARESFIHMETSPLLDLGLCSALGDFEQVRVFIVSHLLTHGVSVFPFTVI
jgi:hypothetical protein